MKERNSSIELLRILAILIIISHHFSVHGVFHVLEKVPPMLIVDNLSWQIIFTQIISGIGGLLGNSIFILRKNKPKNTTGIVPIKINQKSLFP